MFRSSKLMKWGQCVGSIILTSLQYTSQLFHGAPPTNIGHDLMVWSKCLHAFGFGLRAGAELKECFADKVYQLIPVGRRS